MAKFFLQIYRPQEQRAKSKEQRAKSKDKRQKNQDKRENIKTFHLCTNAYTHWLSVVEAYSSLSKTRSLSAVEAGEEKTKEQSVKSKEQRKRTKTLSYVN